MQQAKATQTQGVAFFIDTAKCVIVCPHGEIETLGALFF
jgi:hypothetical protein